MSKILDKRARAKTPPPAEVAPNAPVPVGPRLASVLDVAYRARRPVLLEGPTGIGKSQMVTQFAASAGIDVMVLDLSLLEPPDLVGLPVIRDGRTHYATPAELPTSGRGVLMLEELNRAEIPVMQPALQLLSARRLHAYELPAGWSTVAAINPEEGDYHVNRLDAAMRSRFLQLTVCADRDEWLRWAARANVHPLVRRIAEEHPDVFDAAPPRSWAYVGEILQTIRAEERSDRALVVTALRGYLPVPWALRVAEALGAWVATPAIDADAVLGPNGAHEIERVVSQVSAAGRTDATMMIAFTLRALLRGDRVAEAASRGDVTMASLERLCAALPGDLRDQCLDAVADSPAADAILAGLGLDAAQIAARGYEASGARARVREWRAALLTHRIHLVCARTLRALQRGGQPLIDAIAADTDRQRDLDALAFDAGPLAEDLARWLRARALGAHA
jgi:hypothetical protein